MYVLRLEARNWTYPNPILCSELMLEPIPMLESTAILNSILKLTQEPISDSIPEPIPEPIPKPIPKLTPELILEPILEPESIGIFIEHQFLNGNKKFQKRNQSGNLHENGSEADYDLKAISYSGGKFFSGADFKSGTTSNSGTDSDSETDSDSGVDSDSGSYSKTYSGTNSGADFGSGTDSNYGIDSNSGK